MMAEEDEQMTIRTIFDLEEHNPITGNALFKQRQPTDHLGRFHHWSMDGDDWKALGRPTAFVMTLSPLQNTELKT